MFSQSFSDAFLFLGGNGFFSFLTGVGISIAGGVGNDILSGGEGNDIFGYYNTRGGDDTIVDFQINDANGNSDVIDLYYLLVKEGYTSSDNINDWIELNNNINNDAVIEIDTDGDGITDVSITLQGYTEGVNIDLSDMIANGNIILL